MGRPGGQKKAQKRKTHTASEVNQKFAPIFFYENEASKMYFAQKKKLWWARNVSYCLAVQLGHQTPRWKWSALGSLKRLTAAGPTEVVGSSAGATPCTGEQESKALLSTRLVLWLHKFFPQSSFRVCQPNPDPQTQESFHLGGRIRT